MGNKIVLIQIKNLRLRTIIGFADWERKKLQDVIVNIDFQYDASTAMKTDEREDAVNYKIMTKRIIKEVESSSFNLIESLASKIYDLVYESEGIKMVSVTVEKPHALRFCDNVMVTISDNYE
jgi:FolB domain-containing protein